MRKLIIIPLLFFYLLVNATNYYVATTGSDGAAGTFAAPWATWEKAFTSASVQPGDTVFFRGGVYTMTKTDGWGYDITRSGTAANWIYYHAYPGEVPILDCSNVVPSGTKNHAITNQYLGTSISYLEFKGLVVINVSDDGTGPSTVEAYGWRVAGGRLRWINCTGHDIGGNGFSSNFSNSYGEHWFINCDAYNCNNPNAVSPYLPGNRGTGFSVQNFYSTKGRSYAINCRAWNCGDQGFSFDGDQYCEVVGCWSFANGRLGGDGHGFKLGWVVYDVDTIRRKFVNNIAAYNRNSGFTTNDNVDVRYPWTFHGTISNNISYHNGYFADEPTTATINEANWGWGFVIYNNNSTNDASELAREFYNNISYDNDVLNIFVAPNALYTHSNNTWDAAIISEVGNPTAAWFLSLDSTGLGGPRQADGSLPDIDFLKLTSTAGARGVGVDVGLTYDADSNLYKSPPSIGPYEYYVPGDPEPPTAVIPTVSIWVNGATITGNVSDDGGAIVTDRGVVWSEGANPVIATNLHIHSGSGTGTFVVTIPNLTASTLYYIGVFATNSAGTTYTYYEYTSTGTSVIKNPDGYILKDSSDKVIKIN